MPLPRSMRTETLWQDKNGILNGIGFYNLLRITS